MKIDMAEKLRAIIGKDGKFTTHEKRWHRLCFCTERGDVSKSALDSWRNRGWIENTSTKALPDMERVRAWELTDPGVEALWPTEPLGVADPQQSDDQSPHSPELSGHPEPHDTPR